MSIHVYSWSHNLFNESFDLIHIHTRARTHTHIYIYIYIYNFINCYIMGRKFLQIGFKQCYIYASFSFQKKKKKGPPFKKKKKVFLIFSMFKRKDISYFLHIGDP